ncbi:GGDEF domain-containing phosphodiesterase [Nostoc sp. MG11]|uniref:GGDEF domain-containing phosphodiesterase n=1 Tax=Nostoc sp. MG11 TaxID=2721166 RepID=UPI0018663755|nr:GGDEF domain-containing phosphodiesterase [Nostoc sp. MG11]
MNIKANVDKNAEHLLVKKILPGSEIEDRSLMRNSEKIVFCQADTSGIWIFLNPVWTEITEFTIVESIGKSFLNYIHFDDRQHNLYLLQILNQYQTKDYLHETRYLLKDGGYCWLELYFRVLLDREREIIGTSGTLREMKSHKADGNNKSEENRPSKFVEKIAFNSSRYQDELMEVQRFLLQREIAERKRIEAELEKLLSLQQATLESTADGILVVDSKGNITDFNQKFVQMWRIPESLIKSGNYRQALRVAIKQLENPRKYLATAKELYLQTDAQIHDVNDAILFKDGRTFERYSQPQRINGKIVGRVWSFRDVTAHNFAEAKIRYQAYHDLLTNLPNRALFNERLSETLIQAHQNGSKLAVCFLDLDRFQSINDTLGHAIGDQLLQSVAQRITKCLRSHDTIARWGGDEFTLLLPEISDAKNVACIQKQILAAFKAGFDIENHHLHISLSIGIALYPMHGEDTETLMKHADAALSRVKLQGRNNYQFYHSAINSQASELLILENSLHYALERQEFQVYYQPQVNINTGEISKMEALLRWQHPELGLVPAEKFIPLAEETGLIVPIGEWVLRTACTQNKAWQEALDLPLLTVAVNLSARQFQQPSLVNIVTQILSETKLKPQYLDLEITESVAMQNVALTKVILRELYNMGISISIDDFGTGYCSLSYLKYFPVHCLKIDKSFVLDLASDPHDAAITAAIVALAHGLNLTVVAEGVETEEQCNLLRVIECELVQGHLFSHPVSVEDATKLMRKCKYRRVTTSFLVA